MAVTNSIPEVATSAIRDAALAKYWEYPEYWNAWRLSFEHNSRHCDLLREVLSRLPASWGKVDFLESYEDGLMVVLFTHDLDSDGARRNEFRILSVLAGTGAIKHFGAEGTSGRIDIDRFRSFPTQNTIQSVAEYLFRERKISPLVAVMLCAPVALEGWGIENPDLYEEAKEQLLSSGPGYSSAISRRVPVLYENLLLKRQEWQANVIGATITNYNYWQGHDLLTKRQISHAGISAALEGDIDFGRTIRDMKAPPSPLEQLFKSEGEKEKKQREYDEWRENKDRGKQSQ